MSEVATERPTRLVPSNYAPGVSGTKSIFSNSSITNRLLLAIIFENLRRGTRMDVCSGIVTRFDGGRHARSSIYSDFCPSSCRSRNFRVRSSSSAKVSSSNEQHSRTIYISAMLTLNSLSVLGLMRQGDRVGIRHLMETRR